MTESLTDAIVQAFALGAGSPPSPEAPAGADGPPPPPPEDPGFDDGDGEAPPPANTNWDLVRACAGEHQNDIGNSRRLRIRHGADMLHVQNIGWHVFDGRRWKEDIDAAGTRPLCHAVVEAIALESYVLEPTEREAVEIKAAEEALALSKALKRELRELSEREATSANKARRDAIHEELRDHAPAIERGAVAGKALASRKAQRRRFANTSGNKGKVDGMLAEAVPYLSRAVGDLDADPLAFNVENGTLRFFQKDVEDPDCPDPDVRRTKREFVAELFPHTREDLISKLAAVEYQPAAPAPIFEAMVLRILPAASVRDYVQRFFGYGITALTREQCFALFHGEGRNGKSTLVDIIARIMADYSTSLPIDSLVNQGGAKKGSEATPDLARLPGARMVRTAEPKEGVSFDESLIKGLTSSEPIPVRRLNAEFNDIYPTFKLVVSANRKPEIRGNDDGIWRRVNLVPFDVQIPDAEVDKQLGDKLWEERSGILNWLVVGCLDYLNRGKLDPPEEVAEATRDYRQESDRIGQFAANALDITGRPEDQEETGRLYQAFEVWCRRAGHTPFVQATFQRRLPATAKQLGFTKGKSSISLYQGIRIKPEFVPRFDAPAGPRGYGQGG